VNDQAPIPAVEPAAQANPELTNVTNLLKSAQAFIENMPVSVFRIGDDGTILEVNRQACNVLGYTHDELVGMSLFQVDVATDPERWIQHRKSLKIEGTRKLESIHRRKDGSTIPVEVVVNGYIFQGEQFSYSFVQDISERKLYEATLHASESRFRMLSEATFEGIAITKDGVIIDLNDQMARMLGYDRGELLGKPATICVLPQDREKVASYLLHGRLGPYEHIAIRKDGSQFPVLVRAQNMKINEEETRVSVIRDITDQKLAEESQKKLLRLESEAMQVARLGYWEFDIAGQYFTFNDQYYALHGITAEQAGGYQMSAEYFAQKYVHPDGAREVQDWAQLAVQSDDPHFQFQHDGRILKANGEVVDVKIWFQAEKDRSGKTIRLFGVSQDITSRKRDELALQQSNALLSTIIETAPTPIFSLDLDGRVAGVWNRAAEEMFGWRSNEVMGQFLPTMPKDDPEEVEAFLKRVRDGMLVKGLKVKRKKRDGKSVEYRVFASPLCDPAGDIVGNIAVLVDDREINLANQNLLENRTILEATLESMEEGVLVVAQDWQVSQYNSNFVKIWEIPKDILATRDDRQIIEWVATGLVDAEKFRSEIEYLYQSTRASKDILNLKDNRVIERSSYPLIIAGKYSGRVWIFQDITERKRAETALRESEFFLRKSQDVGDLGSYYFNIWTGTWICSEKLDRLFGIDETFPKTVESWISMIHPEDQAMMLTHLTEHVIAQRNRFDKEYRIIRQNDGELRWVHGLGELELDPSGTPLRMIGTIQDITTRKQADEALQRSEERLRLALEASSDAIWDWDLRTDRFYFSPRYYTMLGYEPNEFPASIDAWTRLLHPESRFQAGQVIQGVIATGSSFSAEFRMQKKDGSWCWIFARGKVVETDQNGKAVRLVGSNADITERKSTEIALQQNEAQLRLLTDNMEDVILQVDREQKIIFMSPSAERAFGHPPGEFIGKQSSLWVHPDDFSRVAMALDHARLTNTSSALVEYRVQNTQGRYLWREATVRLLYDADGKPAGSILCSRDISARKRTESLLRRLNTAASAMQQPTSLEEIFTVASEQLKAHGFLCSIYRVSQDRSALIPVHLTYKSRSVEMLENLTGYQFKSINIPIQPIDSFRLPVMEKQTVYVENIEGNIQQFLPKQLKKFSQTIVTILGVSKTINAPLIVDNTVIGLLAVQADDLLESDTAAITAFAHQLAAAWRKAELFEQAQQEIEARKVAEAQVRQLNEELEKRVNDRTAQLQYANKELEAFAYSVSHDLRAPLRAINGYTRILLEDYQSVLDEEGRRFCGVISEEGARMGQLIDDLLEFSRLGRTEMQTVPVDMNALVKSAFHDLTTTEDVSRIKFRKHRLVDTEADPNLMRQVWANLLSNAIKFSHNCPIAKIEVGSSQEGDQVTYWVKDNGAGFDMQYQNKLFGVFQRLHSASEFEGTGVGLAIVQRIVHRHGGSVWAIGNVGEGATFSFSLPKRGKNHEHS
jgi:PAS domain S-box-containing protein